MKDLWGALEERGIYPQHIDACDDTSTFESQDESTDEARQESTPARPIHESEVDIKAEVEDADVMVQ